jgi:hypothetical protein
VQVKPLKVRERGDAARYILRVVVTDKAGCERDDMGATNARGLLAALNGVSLAAAQLLLDRANDDYDEARKNRETGVYPDRQEGQRKVEGDKEDEEADDTLIEDEPSGLERKL